MGDLIVNVAAAMALGLIVSIFIGPFIIAFWIMLKNL
jgi:hypothetical protein